MTCVAVIWHHAGRTPAVSRHSQYQFPANGSKIPNDVANAWAAVYIDVAEKIEAAEREKRLPGATPEATDHDEPK